MKGQQLQKIIRQQVQQLRKPKDEKTEGAKNNEKTSNIDSSTQKHK